MNKQFHLGSQWRKWDLQVQTILDDGYKQLSDYHANIKQLSQAKWVEFVSKVGGENNALKFDSKDYFNDNRIEKKLRCSNYADTLFAFLETYKSGLGCIGITDHNYFDSYLMDALAERSKRSDIKVICGVEINISGVHILAFFKTPPFRDASFSNGIIKFLNSIDVHQKNTNGKLTVSSCSLNTATQKIREHEGLYIFPHCNSDNGLFQERGKTDRTYLSGEYNRKRRILLQCKSRKSIEAISKYIKSDNLLFQSQAIFTSSPDSRCLADIGKADDDGNFCWVKSNPGFTGLKQIVYEPDRVSISSLPPEKIQKSKIIRSVSISDTNGWLNKNFSIELNESQISIIGSKGSGKTALLDLIAFGSKSYEYHENSFLARATKNKSSKSIAGAEIIITWYDGASHSARVPSATQLQRDKVDLSKGQILYLSQNFVEKLCSHDELEELNKQIEAVIFQKIPKEDKAGYNGFQHYKGSKLSIIDKEKARIKNAINESNRIIAECRTYIDSENETRLQETQKISELVEMMTEQELLIKSISAKAGEEIQALSNQKSTVASLEQELSLLQQSIHKCLEVKYSIEVFNKNSFEFAEQLRDTLNSNPLGIDSNLINSIQVKLRPKNLISTLEATHNSIKDSIENKHQLLLSERIKLGEIENLLGEENIKRNNVIAINDKIEQVKTDIASIKNLVNIIEIKKYEIEWEFEERKTHFVEYLNILRLERAELINIYAPIKADLTSSVEHNTSLLSFSVISHYDIDSVAAEGESIIDHSKAGLFYRQDSSFLKSELAKHAFQIAFDDELGNPLDEKEFKIQNSIQVENYLRNIEKLFGAKLESQLRKGATYTNFDKWLFNPDTFSVGYGVYFNNTPLNQLSPGMKGMALLILFLELDTDDVRPILIDQPEENLDNRSIYETLRKYFRTAKNRRQIIIATHNPNLVVNTDTEQIIVANFSRSRAEQEADIAYTTGALECEIFNDNSTQILDRMSIRQHICHILEGGEDAFKQRELRYGLPK